jgi:hypothetical protein
MSNRRIGLAEYLQSGAFGEAVFENWESEFLQMGLYVLLTSFLFQRGSAESNDPDGSDEPESASCDPAHAPLAARKGGLVSKIYSHSLSIAFAALFALSFAGMHSGERGHTTWNPLNMARVRFPYGNTWKLPSSGLNPFRIGKVSFWRSSP